MQNNGFNFKSPPFESPGRLVLPEKDLLLVQPHSPYPLSIGISAAQVRTVPTLLTDVTLAPFNKALGESWEKISMENCDDEPDTCQDLSLAEKQNHNLKK